MGFRIDRQLPVVLGASNNQSNMWSIGTMTSRSPRELAFRHLSKNAFRHARIRGVVSVAAALALASSLIPGYISPVQADSKTSTSKTPSRLSDDKKVLHLLDRIGFGARPGD